MPRPFGLKSGRNVEIRYTNTYFQGVSKTHFDIVIWTFKIQLKYHFDSITFEKESKLYTRNKFCQSITYTAKPRKLKK